VLPEVFVELCAVPDDPAFLGTFAPSVLASDNPMAIACFGFVTFLSLRPLFNWPPFISCMERSTLFCASFEYFAIKKVL
jgi:hypothetical protein